MKGFTLLELLVVILVVGILAAIALPVYQKAAERSRAAEAMSFLDSLNKAQNFYQLEKGTFTDDFSDLVIGIPKED